MRVTIESPFRADSDERRKEHEVYLLRALKDSSERGEAPFASHAIYPRILNDSIATERDLGIKMGYAWMEVAEGVIFYTDYGWSEGMRKARNRAKKLQKFIAYRRIGRTVL